MKTTYLLLTVLVGLFLFLSCKKNELIIPTAVFSFRGDTSSVIKLATYDTCTLFNNSINSDSSFWNLGGGVVSIGTTALLSYNSSGNYHVTLTVKSKDGHTSSETKEVIVLDRVLKRIIINKVYWDTIPNNIPYYNAVWPTIPVADIFVQIQKYRFGDSIVPRSGILYNSPILFKSQVINNVPYNTSQPIEIPVSKKFIINKEMVLNRSFAVSLMAIDKNNNVYSLLSSLGSGTNFMITVDDLAKNEFKITCGYFSGVELDCDFE